MEQFPGQNKDKNKEKPDKKPKLSSTLKATALAANTALAAGSYAAYDNYSEQSSQAPETVAESTGTHAVQEKNNQEGQVLYANDARPYKQETKESASNREKQQAQVVSGVEHTTLRPEARPEKWHALSEFEHPLAQLDFMIANEAQRLGLAPELFRQRLEKLFNLFADIESDWDNTALNKESSAQGYYQYLTENNSPGEQDGSIHTAIHRMSDVLARQGVIDAKSAQEKLAWASALYKDPKQISETPLEAQQILVFSDIIQQPGTDELLVALTSEDISEQRQAVLELYYKAHHTNPTPEVRANAERDTDKYFPSQTQQG